MKPKLTPRYFTLKDILPACLLTAAAFALAGPAAAQQLRLNDEVLCEFTNQAIVNFTDNGSVEIYDDCEISTVDPVPLSVNWVDLVPASVKSGDPVNVYWGSSGAAGCHPASSGSPQPGTWLGEELDHFESRASFTAPSNDGTYQIGVECFDEDNQTDVKYAALTVSEETLPQPTLTFTITTSTAEPGQTIRTNWQSEHATSCSATSSPQLNDWKGTMNISGTNHSVSIPSSATHGQVYDLKLICNGPGGTSSQITRKVTVKEEPSAPSGCESRTISGYSIEKNPQVDRNGSNWENVFRYWPGSSGHTVIRLPRNRYAAIEFTPSEPPNNSASISMQVISTSVTPPSTSNMLLSISTCPGDFGKTAIDNDPMMGGKCVFTGTTRIAYKGGTEDDRIHCMVESGKRYYLNIIPRSGGGIPLESDDVEWQCGFDENAQSCGTALGLGVSPSQSQWPD